MSKLVAGKIVRARHDIIQDANDYSPDLLMARRGQLLVIDEVMPEGHRWGLRVFPVGRANMTFYCKTDEIIND